MNDFLTNYYLPRVRKHTFFRSFSAEQFDLLTGNIRFHQLKAGSTLYIQDEEVDRFYLLLQGVVKIFRVANDGRETLLELYHDMQCIAASDLFSDTRKYSANAGIVEDAILISFSSCVYKELLLNSSNSCFSVLTEMACSHQHQLNEIDSLSNQSASDRVIHFLLSQIKDTEVKQDAVEIRIPIAKRLIAARLFMQPETFSRILAGFRRQGVLDVQGSRFCINSLTDLRQMV